MRSEKETKMTIKEFKSYPKLTKWQKWLRKICGGQDFVAIVYIDDTGIKYTTWFTGVDMKNPVESCPDSASLFFRGKL